MPLLLPLRGRTTDLYDQEEAAGEVLVGWSRVACPSGGVLQKSSKRGTTPPRPAAGAVGRRGGTSQGDRVRKAGGGASWCSTMKDRSVRRLRRTLPDLLPRPTLLLLRRRANPDTKTQSNDLRPTTFLHQTKKHHHQDCPPPRRVRLLLPTHARRRRCDCRTDPSSWDRLAKYSERD